MATENKTDGILPMWNGRAPRGWIEIQRDDERKRPSTDYGAARALCRRAGYPIQVAQRWDHYGGGWIYGRPQKNHWIAVVPLAVARIAGLISRGQEIAAYRGHE